MKHPPQVPVQGCRDEASQCTKQAWVPRFCRCFSRYKPDEVGAHTLKPKSIVEITGTAGIELKVVEEEDFPFDECLNDSLTTHLNENEAEFQNVQMERIIAEEAVESVRPYDGMSNTGAYLASNEGVAVFDISTPIEHPVDYPNPGIVNIREQREEVFKLSLVGANDGPSTHEADEIEKVNESKNSFETEFVTVFEEAGKGPPMTDLDTDDLPCVPPLPLSPSAEPAAWKYSPSLMTDFVPPSMMTEPFIITPRTMGFVAPNALPSPSFRFSPSRSDVRKPISPRSNIPSPTVRWSDQKKNLSVSFSQTESKENLSVDCLPGDLGKLVNLLDGPLTEADKPVFDPIIVSPTEDLEALRVCKSAFSAVRHNKYEEIEQLIRDFPKLVHAKDRTPRENTLLHTACSSGFSRIAKLLIQGGANVDALNTEGNSPLHIAYQYGKNAIVSILIGSGANENARNNKDRIPAQMLSGSFPSSLEASPAKQ